MSWYDIFYAEGKDLNEYEVIFRTALIFIFSLIAIRLAKKRFLGKNTAFDVILGVIAGSVASRAINGSAKLFPTMVSLVVLVAFHWVVSALTSKSNLFGNLVEGRPAKLVQDGKLDYDMLGRHHFRELDVLESARLKANIDDIKNIKEAYLEVSGEISVIK